MFDYLSFINKHYLGNRVAVSSDMDSVISDVNKLVGGTVLQVPCGGEALNWVMPPKWTVHEATLVGPDGNMIADFRENPMRIWSYSAPVKGTFSLQELLPHLYVREHSNPDVFSYHYSNHYKYEGYKSGEWGFCLSQNEYDSLIEGNYTVKIDAECSFDSTLKVLDAKLEGDKKDTILLCAHNCHPGQVNDGIAAVALAIDIFSTLAQRPSRRYTYRLVIGPEFFGAAVFLSQASDIESVIGGVYLDDVAYPSTVQFALSHGEDGFLDRIARLTLPHIKDDFAFNSFHAGCANDEHFYEDADFKIPFNALYRAHLGNHHFNTDSPENFDTEAYEESKSMVFSLLDAIEHESVPRKKYVGPLYQSRYGLSYSMHKSRLHYDCAKMIHFHMDGINTDIDIAEKLKMPLHIVRETIEVFKSVGAVDSSDPK